MPRPVPAPRTTIGILETGRTPPTLIDRFGRYDAMMRRMLGDAHATTTYDVMSGDWPAGVETHAAYLITGSSAGVYDPLPWIEPLKRFLRDAQGRAKLVGICFGHQIMAEAFGGRVEKSAKGWGLGLHRYAIGHPAAWMDSGADVAIPVSHQDQVIARPAEAEVLGGNEFTPFGMLAYPARRAISFQFHPEFDTAFARELVELRRPAMAEATDADRAQSSLDDPSDAPRVAGWIRRFLAEP